MRLILAVLLLLWACHNAKAQYYPCWGCGYARGYGGYGTYQAWPRRWGGWNPGISYYGPGYYRPFSYWGRNPYYRY